MSCPATSFSISTLLGDAFRQRSPDASAHFQRMYQHPVIDRTSRRLLVLPVFVIACAASARGSVASNQSGAAAGKAIEPLKPTTKKISAGIVQPARTDSESRTRRPDRIAVELTGLPPAKEDHAALFTLLGSVATASIGFAAVFLSTQRQLRQKDAEIGN